MQRTSNPALNSRTFSEAAEQRGLAERMTIEGTVTKTGLLMICVLLTATWTWNRFFATGNPAAVAPYTLVGALGGFVVALATIFKKTWAPVTAPLYALLEGLFLGGVSATLEVSYPGIPMQAVGLTFGTLAGLLIAYRSGWIRATEKFKLGVVAATFGIMAVYLVTFVLGFFGVQMPLIYGNGVISIGFSVFVVIIASLNLILDFDFIETGARQGAPKYMEWYAGFGLMVTLIWLYLEMLRLLAKLSSRR